MRTYDSKDVNIIVGGVVITGLAESSFVTAERSEDNFEEYIGAQGEVSLAESNNETGGITITLEATSPSVPYLNELANRKGESAIIPVNIVDLNVNAIQVSAERARIRKPSDYEADKGITEREVVLFCEKLEFK